MLRALFLTLCLCTITTSIWAQQSAIVFNKTEHDFGQLATTEVPFEHDFLFRNTGNDPITVLSVRSVHSALRFIHTRSEVYEGEYGFVKVKLRTDSLEGLFHDEVYITMRQGKEVVSEVIYLRANITSEGREENGRQFDDSRIATSVEVSPDDIETLEGFLGQDKLVQAEAEITYLRKQVGLKSELISKLSEDLQAKQQSEEENIQRLAALQQTLQQGTEKDVEVAMQQIDQLTKRLIAIQRSDSVLRSEIYDQEALYAQLKHEADSARNYAENLSKELEKQFQAEAEAMERASKLQRDLNSQRITEQKQQEQIDSLQNLLAMEGSSNEEISREIDRLTEELTLKKREQELQAAHAKRQHEKIDQLKAEREALKSKSDSLNRYLSSRNQENEALQTRLTESTQRISSYETLIDSLELQAQHANLADSAYAELDSLKGLLGNLEDQDKALKQTISEKDVELASLQSEKDQSQKDMKALEAATARQLEEAHKLMYKINDLSSRESKARMEVMDLKTALKSSESREDSTRTAVLNLTNRIAERETSIQQMGQALNAKEAELAWAKGEQETLQREYEKTRNDLQASQSQIDSLKQVAAQANTRKNNLENDITTLQEQIVESQRRADTQEGYASELEAKLENARMSNELAFEEMKADVDEMRTERDDYRKKYQETLEELQSLSDELAESRQREKNAMRLVSEIGQGAEPKVETVPAAEVIFRVQAMTSKKQESNLRKLEKFGDVLEYREEDAYRYAVGKLHSLGEAIALKNQLKEEGFTTSHVVAFRNGERISLKEAMETAGN